MANIPAKSLQDNLIIVAIGTASGLTFFVLQRWPFGVYLMFTSPYVMWFVQAVFFPYKLLPGSRAISALMAICLWVGHTLTYIWNSNRPILIQAASILSVFIAIYLICVGGTWLMHTPQQKARASMDDYLWEVTRFVFDTSIFYIVTSFNIAMILIATKRGMVQSAAQLKQLRITNFRVYSKELAKIGLLIAGLIGTQASVLYYAGLGLIELVCSQIVVIFAMWKVVSPQGV